MYPFCDKCGGVLPGATTAMVGAYPCTCNENQSWTYTSTTTTPLAPAVDEATLRRIMREEIERAFRVIPGSEAERLANDYLASLGDDEASDGGGS